MEIEVKLHLADEKALRTRLALLKAAYKGMVHQHDHLLDFDDGRLRKNDQLVRVRELKTLHGTHMGKRHILITYKGPQQKSKLAKKREEQETESHESLHDILETAAEMGLRPRMDYEKYRESYYLLGAHVEIDYFPKFPHLGKFVEIEGRNEGQIATIMKLLKLDKKQLEPKSYAALLQEAQARTGSPKKTARRKKASGRKIKKSKPTRRSSW